jgi:hypothetical protein
MVSIQDIVSLIVSIFLIAGVSMGVECYNKNDDWVQTNRKSPNKGVMYVILVIAILGALIPLRNIIRG